MMDITITIKDGIKTLELNGRLDGVSSEEAAQKMLAEIDDNVNLVIDMTNCQYVSSAGLRVLLMVGKRIKMQSGTMKFINLCEEVEEVMEITGFGEIFKGFEN